MVRSLLRLLPPMTLFLSLAFALPDTARADPDLVLEQIQVVNMPSDSTYNPGDSFTVTGTIRNDGDEESGDYTFDFYAGDYHIGSLSDSSLGAGWYGGFGTSCSLPDNIPLDDYSVWVRVSWSHGGSQYENEASGDDITVAAYEPPAPDPPDLRLYDVSITNRPSDNVYYPGDSVDIQCDVENIGGETSDSYTVDFYADGYSIDSQTFDAMEPGGWEVMGTTWSIPDDSSVGSYSITCELSCSNDSDSGNNSSYAEITVGEEEPPDISIASVEATDGVYKPGDSITVRIGVECGDGQVAGDMDVDFYASADREITRADHKIKNAGFANLEPGESYTFDTTCRFPSHLPDGYYYIGTMVTSPDAGDVACDQHAVWVSEPMDPTVQSVRATAGTYSPGDEIRVYSLVKNIGQRASESYVVDYYVSTDSTITTADYKIGYVDRGGLAPGQQHSFNTFCRLPLNVPAGDCYIGIVVTCPKDYDTTNNADRGSATVEVVHPAGYVCGRADYEDKRSQEQPIRYALVEVYAEDNNNDPLDDSLLGQTHTDQDGIYALILANDGNSGRDIYVKVLSEGVSGAHPGTTSKMCTLKDAVLDEVYALVSDLHPHPGSSSVVIDMTSPRFEGGEFMVFDSIVEGFSKARTFLNIELDELKAYWPGEAKVSYFDPDMMEIYISQGDRGDRDVIMHEYAHYIADVYGVAQGEVGDDSTHYWDQDLRGVPSNRTDEQATNLAFREAWPTWFSIAAQYGDTGYPYSGDSSYDDEDEDGRWTLKVDLDVDGNTDFWPGQYFENMNAATLWDIFDDKNDGGDTLSDPSLTKIWTISRDYKPENILDFWNNWFEKYEYEDEMKHIFNTHNMWFTVPE